MIQFLLIETYYVSVQENEKIKKLLCRPALGKAESSVYFLNEAIC